MTQTTREEIRRTLKEDFSESLVELFKKTFRVNKEQLIDFIENDIVDNDSYIAIESFYILWVKPKIQKSDTKKF